MLQDYSFDTQKLFLEMLIEDAQTYARIQNIFNAANFEKPLQPLAEFIKEHCLNYQTMPDLVQMNAQFETQLRHVPDLNDGHYDWFLTEFENFTKRQELERAILKSADLLEQGNYTPVEKLIKDAVQISLTRDMGTDYFDDPRARLRALKDNNGQNSSGWPVLDKMLYGGFNRGELQIFAGGSGSGKSLFMQNLAVNWVQAGLNGVYVTLELSEGLTAMRIDSMLTDTASRDIFRDLDQVELKVRMLAKKSGNLRIKYMPAQSTVNDIRAYIKELQIQAGKPVDFLCIDYLDLLMPVSAKVSPNDQFIKDKYVSEEIRNLSKELNVLMVTASQLNRSAVEEIEFDHSHIAGGISKINTADNVFGIFTSRAMRERGKYQIQAMKTRSSSGVGQKIELAFDINTLRIFDNGDSEQDALPVSSIYQNLKTSSNVNNNNNSGVNTGGDVAKTAGNVQSNKLKSLLANIKN